MKLIKKVNALEVKRCFAITHFMRKFGIARKSDLVPPTRKKYLTVLKKSKHAVENLNESQLNKIVGEYKKRLHAYNAVQWHIGEVGIKETGVWKGAGGLPISWTKDSLFDTAKKVKEALQKDSEEIQRRSKRAIPAIIKFKSIMKKEKYLFPIVFESGVGTNIRRGLPKNKLNIDDGSMRGIAYTISGDKKIKAYIGVARK